MCGSDGNTYSSTCHLLQQAAGVNISYGERCNDVKCSGGQVILLLFTPTVPTLCTVLIYYSH